MSYSDDVRMRIVSLIKETSIFNGDLGDGSFHGKEYDFILKDGNNNLYPDSKDAMLDYFKKNGIAWWNGREPTNNPRSSQIACLNHLFPSRQDKDAVLSIVKGIDSTIVDVMRIESDAYDPAFIQFEAVSDIDHLNERASTRGSNCTSIDALILAVREDGAKVLIPIEWKYTENYGNQDKSMGSDGHTRKLRYSDLIANSMQLSSQNCTIYYYEPFYQLMRQTLWAEQMVAHRDTEIAGAEDFVHVHVIPSGNKELLNKKYRCSRTDMETTWRSCITDQKKYRILTPEELLEPLNKVQYQMLLDYLALRYWDSGSGTG